MPSMNAVSLRPEGKLFTYLTLIYPFRISSLKGVPSVESSRSVRGVGKGVSGKPYPRLCNARRPRLDPRIFLSQAVRLYRLHPGPSDFFFI